MSPRLALPLLQPGQAQKEMFHNEALIRIDAALHPAAATTALDDPPTSPAAGAGWIVGTAPSGAWVGRSGTIATWTSGGWSFISPVAGMALWIADLGRWAWHDGAAWRTGPLPTAGVAVNGIQVIGAQRPAISGPAGGTTIDTEARATIGQILTTMRDHGLIDT